MRGGNLVRNVRLVSGLILMAFVVCHLANLAVGMHSLAQLEAWREVLTAPWTRSRALFSLLAAAALTHAGLGLYAIASRRSLALSPTDVAQLLLGLVTPPLLIAHAIALYTAIRVAPAFPDAYGQIQAVYWSFAPYYAFQQLFVVVVVWMHAAIGLYSWLVLKPVWRRIGGFVLPVLFAVPILALLGFAQSGQEVLNRLAADPAWRAQVLENVGNIAKVTRELGDLQSRAILVWGLLVAASFAILAARILRARAMPVEVAYDDGQRAQGRYGLSILEVSLLNDVPHAHVCSGRGRCGTCRVRVDAGAEALSRVGEQERATLERVGAAPGERLACQAQVLGAGVAVTRLLPAFADATAAQAPAEWNADAAKEPA